MKRWKFLRFLAFLTLLLLLIFLGGCVGMGEGLGEKRGPGDERAKTDQEAVDETGEDGTSSGDPERAESPDRIILSRQVLHPLKGHNLLVEALGPPETEELRKEENRHDPELTDTVVTWTWPGISCIFFRSGYDEREFMVLIELSSSGWALPGGIGPGMSRSELIGAYGEPDRIEGNRLLYLSEPLTREFHLSGEQIERVRVIAFSP